MIRDIYIFLVKLYRLALVVVVGASWKKLALCSSVCQGPRFFFDEFDSYDISFGTPSFLSP